MQVSECSTLSEFNLVVMQTTGFFLQQPALVMCIELT